MTLTLIVLGLTVALFIWGRIRSDVVALSALAVLMVAGVLSPTEALAGFSSSVVIMMAGLFVVGGAIFQTGLARETGKRMMENKFDMNDMLAQFAQIRKMGGAGAMLSMMPGMSGIDASQVDEKAFDRIEAMIYSMTKEEREKPSIINPKRKRRIAAGSGTKVEDVNKLLKQFEMMQKMMKQFKKSPKGFARRLGGMMGNPNAFRGLK